MADLPFYFAVLLALMTIAGMIKPWWVLWWSSKANRLLVLRYYGALALLLFLVWLFIS